MMVELFTVLLCFNPDEDILKQAYLAENYHVEVYTGEPDTECHYTTVEFPLQLPS
jgi:hypothetical protein